MIEIINEFELGNAVKLINRIRSSLIQKGKEKLDAEGRGFGKHNDIDNIDFDKDAVFLEYVDSGYDLRDTVTVRLTISEICMTDQEWKAYILTIANERDKAKKERDRLNEELKKKNREKDYLRLKEEFE